MISLFKGWWKVIAALALGATAYFFKWRSEVNKRKANRAQDRVEYLETKAKQEKASSNAVEEQRKKNREEIRKLKERRRQGKREGGLGKW